MNNNDLTYEELKLRLTEAESALTAIRSEQVDAVIGAKDVYRMHLSKIEDALKLSEEKLDSQTAQSKRLTTKLAESEQKHRELIKYAGTGIYEIDYRKLRFTYVNDAMCQMLGYTREELLAMHPGELLDDEGRKELTARVTQWLGGEKPDDNVEYKLRARDGRILDVILYATYTVDEEGKPLGAMVIGHDLTARKKVEKALQESKERLELCVNERTAELNRKNETLKTEIAKNEIFQAELKAEREKLFVAYQKRDFLSRQLVDLLERDRREIGSALHDQIGQVMTGILIRLEELCELRAADGMPLASRIEPIQALLSEAMEQTRNISRYLRPEILERFGLIHSVKEFIDEIQKYFPGKIYFYHKGICENFKDGVKDLVIYRIIQESLHNTLKHAQATEIFINLTKRNDYFFLAVEDNGSGFDYDKIFEKTDPCVKSLGITIMRERASLAGGAFRIDSSPGHGTCVQAEIPLSDVDHRRQTIRDVAGTADVTH